MDQNFADLLMENLKEIKKEIKAVDGKLDAKMADHDKKFDTIFAFKWKFIGAYSAIMLILTLAMQLVSSYLQKG